MKNTVMKISLMALGGIFCIFISQGSNVLWGKFYDGDAPFFFPAAFILAALYGWFSRNYPASFLVGFLAVPYMVPFPGFQSGSVVVNLVRALFHLSKYNNVDLAIIVGFGIAAGLCGMGLAKLARRRKKEKALS
jgi:hypothetical protein